MSSSVENLYYTLKTMAAVLPKRTFNFLSCWYEICRDNAKVFDDDDNHFGFIGERGLNNQSKAAIKFLADCDNKWNKMVAANSAELTFAEYFYKRAVEEGIKLPENFVFRVVNLLKALEAQ